MIGRKNVLPPLALAALVLLPATLIAQADAFARLDLPTPNAYRTASGAPGPAYWQQRASYRIEATLDTATTSLSGKETITYANHSPDTLRFVWLQADQNIYRPNSRGSFLFPSGARFGGGGFAGGLTLGPMAVDGHPVKPYVNGTLLRLDLPRPLAPGHTIAITASWSFPVPAHGSDRMGRAGKLYEMAEWYPRMVVYDDVHGWNTDPYLGQGEFYLEYGDFDVSLTVPAGYVVAATGTLQNPKEVLTASERQRLQRARGATTTVHIIGQGEAGSAAARPKTTGTLTWRWRAHDVRDFAWAGSPDFQWDAISKNGVLCHAFYEPTASAAWRTAADMTCFSIDEYSTRWMKYPYPFATSVAGPVAGMEYPMIVFVRSRGNTSGVFHTLTHEIGHQWFPMVVGSNERRYAWMDEGFNTFINTFSNERRFPGDDERTGYLASYWGLVRTGLEQPMMTPPDLIRPFALGAVAYRKPALVLLMLRNQVLGPATFDAAFREYARRWAFKHPTPADFFRTMEDVSGRDLSWFFREWMYGTDVLDQAVDSVLVASANGAFPTTIYLSSRTPVIMPVDLRIRLANGETRDVHLPVQIWSYGTTYAYRVVLPAAPTAVTVDPDAVYPDRNRWNNSWQGHPR